MAQYSVRVFGIFKDIVQADHVKVELDIDLTLGALKHQLEERYPKFKQVNYMTAVNREYCRNDELLLTGEDEIAFLPPVAGG